jgi:hypothetical protein
LPPQSFAKILPEYLIFQPLNPHIRSILEPHPSFDDQNLAMTEKSLGAFLNTRSMAEDLRILAKQKANRKVLLISQEATNSSAD